MFTNSPHQIRLSLSRYLKEDNDFKVSRCGKVVETVVLVNLVLLYS